jgi:spore maturation protein A
MLNHIWFAMILLAILIAAGSDIYNELMAPKSLGISELEKESRNLNEETKLGRVTSAALEGAGTAVEIAIGLIGIMALWLGVMKVAQEAGITNIIAKIVRPITRRLFPKIPEDHPAIGAMIMNIAANMLGLSNAATPLGLKAMEELDTLNPNKGEATDDMCTFLVINTSAITLIPATAIAIRASVGSANPQMIIIPSILAATCATIVGVTTVKLIQSFNRKKEVKHTNTTNREKRKDKK